MKIRSKLNEERHPEFLPSECLGEACPNFTGSACDDSEVEWMRADAPTKKRDTKKPPFKDDTRYIIYGQRCLTGEGPELVAQRVEIYKPDEVNMAGIIAITGMYGEMPVEVVNGYLSGSIQNIVTSE